MFTKHLLFNNLQNSKKIKKLILVQRFVIDYFSFSRILDIIANRQFLLYILQFYGICYSPLIFCLH